MTISPDTHDFPFGRPAEPLPAEFDDGLREIDALLARRASLTSVPRHLADAVYDATLGLFWERQDPLRLPSRTPRRTIFGRLAMAATLAMACLIAARFITPPVEADANVQMAGLLPAEVEQIIMESPLAADDETDYLYLFDAHGVSYEDISGDLDQIVEELEL